MSQVSQLTLMWGLMSDPLGNLVEFPIISNFKEGLTLTEYLISCYGAWKGIIDTGLWTATAGDFTWRLVDVAHSVIINNFDCGTQNGIYLSDLILSKNKKNLFPLKQWLFGRIIANNSRISSNYRNREISRDFLEKKNYENNKIESFEWNSAEISVRSPLTCETSPNPYLCWKCYGWNAVGRMIDIGEAVGILAAQSLGEPGTQLTLWTFHTGGIYSEKMGDFKLIAPFDGNLIIPNLCTIKKFFHNKEMISTFITSRLLNTKRMLAENSIKKNNIWRPEIKKEFSNIRFTLKILEKSQVSSFSSLKKNILFITLPQFLFWRRFHLLLFLKNRWLIPMEWYHMLMVSPAINLKKKLINKMESLVFFSPPQKIHWRIPMEWSFHKQTYEIAHQWIFWGGVESPELKWKKRKTDWLRILKKNSMYQKSFVLKTTPLFLIPINKIIKEKMPSIFTNLKFNWFFGTISKDKKLEKLNFEIQDLIYRPTFEMTFLKSINNTKGAHDLNHGLQPKIFSSSSSFQKKKISVNSHRHKKKTSPSPFLPFYSARLHKPKKEKEVEEVSTFSFLRNKLSIKKKQEMVLPAINNFGWYLLGENVSGHKNQYKMRIQKKKISFFTNSLSNFSGDEIIQQIALLKQKEKLWERDSMFQWIKRKKKLWDRRQLDFSENTLWEEKNCFLKIWAGILSFTLLNKISSFSHSFWNIIWLILPLYFPFIKIIFSGKKKWSAFFRYFNSHHNISEWWTIPWTFQAHDTIPSIIAIQKYYYGKGGYFIKVNLNWNHWFFFLPPTKYIGVFSWNDFINLLMWLPANKLFGKKLNRLNKKGERENKKMNGRQSHFPLFLINNLFLKNAKKKKNLSMVSFLQNLPFKFFDVFFWVMENRESSKNISKKEGEKKLLIKEKKTVDFHFVGLFWKSYHFPIQFSLNYYQNKHLNKGAENFLNQIKILPESSFLFFQKYQKFSMTRHKIFNDSIFTDYAIGNFWWWTGFFAFYLFLFDSRFIPFILTLFPSSFFFWGSLHDSCEAFSHIHSYPHFYSSSMEEKNMQAIQLPPKKSIGGRFHKQAYEIIPWEYANAFFGREKKKPMIPFGLDLNEIVAWTKMEEEFISGNDSNMGRAFKKMESPLEFLRKKVIIGKGASRQKDQKKINWKQNQLFFLSFLPLFSRGMKKSLLKGKVKETEKIENNFQHLKKKNWNEFQSVNFPLFLSLDSFLVSYHNNFSVFFWGSPYKIYGALQQRNLWWKKKIYCSLFNQPKKKGKKKLLKLWPWINSIFHKDVCLNEAYFKKPSDINNMLFSKKVFQEKKILSVNFLQKNKKMGWKWKKKKKVINANKKKKYFSFFALLIGNIDSFFLFQRTSHLHPFFPLFVEKYPQAKKKNNKNVHWFNDKGPIIKRKNIQAIQLSLKKPIGEQSHKQAYGIIFWKYANAFFGWEKKKTMIPFGLVSNGIIGWIALIKMGEEEYSSWGKKKMEIKNGHMESKKVWFFYFYLLNNFINRLNFWKSWWINNLNFNFIYFHPFDLVFKSFFSRNSCYYASLFYFSSFSSFFQGFPCWQTSLELWSKSQRQKVFDKSNAFLIHYPLYLLNKYSLSFKYRIKKLYLSPIFLPSSHFYGIFLRNDTIGKPMESPAIKKSPPLPPFRRGGGGGGGGRLMAGDIIINDGIIPSEYAIKMGGRPWIQHENKRKPNRNFFLQREFWKKYDKLKNFLSFSPSVYPTYKKKLSRKLKKLSKKLYTQKYSSKKIEDKFPFLLNDSSDDIRRPSLSYPIDLFFFSWLLRRSYSNSNWIGSFDKKKKSSRGKDEKKGISEPYFCYSSNDIKNIKSVISTPKSIREKIHIWKERR